jgi:hypothetical protein
MYSYQFCYSHDRLLTIRYLGGDWYEPLAMATGEQWLRWLPNTSSLVAFSSAGYRRLYIG